ncbi:MAG: hypothetical protein A3H50_01150 [Candidatus Levybacteria bacterium RIFCSPLOWO2_02_FULL_37_10]|nr:MAG: hypothetical protein A2860_04340 [Candidatus Levybacteria bacterium RIFCSPHIGHO2_01_FULL_37_33]OGH16844.1 MAG: hypothetical protein A3C97_01320 [Candidatus Levybacteria bacterium RIFCSPHIGHO2_02_FULL_37_11]OGH29829.1 MAG: hypothetical protein A3F30_00415 [Candidatus Levybacteria bacterium RIFCSPHIGHO2_12_FULL_37_12]OGH46141.1 MAG: hypothetical protein A3H50_01150 [Candidatus Levybacteria bacterium RIFCSPLOWO2_02_FULL_37_10]
MKRVVIKNIILSYKKTGSFVLTAKELGISKWTVKRWVMRGKTLSWGYIRWKGLVRKSTRPHTIHYAISPKLESEIVNLREQKHTGSRKLHYMIGRAVSHMTIHRLLRRKNLVRIQPNYLRPLFQNGKAMRPSNTKELGYLQMDTKHVTPELSGLPFTVYEYAAIDIVSRYKQAIIFPDISSDSASLAFQTFLKWFPFEVSYVQTDNGLEFQAEFQKLCIEKNIQHYFIHKNLPNENAVVERAFKTDQDEFYYWLKREPLHIGELNEWLQEFIIKYNTKRFHQALGYKRPIEIVRMLQMS